MVYQENFEGSTDWPLFDRKNENARIENNRYILDNYWDKGKFSVERECDFDHNKDHEIEFLIGMNSESNKNSYPIIQLWASKKQSYALFLDFPHHKVDVYYYKDYKSKKSTRFKLGCDKYSKKVNSLKVGFLSKVTIRKIKNDIYLFVNKEFIAKLPYNKVRGNKLIFNVYERSLIEIDYITVKALTPLKKIGGY